MRRKNKILIVSNMFPDSKHPSYGVFVEKFCKQVDEIGITYSLSVMHKADSKMGKIIKYVFFYVATFFRVLFGNYNLIYVHYPSFSGAPVDLATHIKAKCVYTNVHGSDVVPENNKHEKMQKYTKRLLEKSKKVVVPSEYFKTLVIKKYGLKNESVFVYPSGGIDPKIFCKKDKSVIEEFKKIYGINSQFPIYGMAGRISKDKGWDVFVDAVNSIKEKVTFVIVGTGNEDSMLEKKLEEKKSNIIWIKKLMPQEDLALFYSICDFFVFPTKRAGESLGLVAIEAMACGIPIIASDYAAPKYYVNDDYNGYKFNMGESEDLAEIIKKTLILSKEKKIELSEGASKTAEKYYCSNLIETVRKIL